MSHFPSDAFPVIQTERLLLRQIQPNDLQALYTLRSNTQVLAYVDRAPLENIDAAATLLQQIEERYSSREGIMWILTLKDNPQHMIGNCGFWRIEWENHRAEVGYLLHPDYWNKGYMTEALQPLIRYAFHTMQLHSVEARVNPGNKGSIRILEKAGFVQEAYFKENYYFNNRYLDTAVFSLLSPR